MYNFVEWGQDRLMERFDILEQVKKVPHSEPRKSQIEHEYTHALFELCMRKAENEANNQR